MATLSPIDLLSMSPAEQVVLRCLTRHSQLTIFELARQTRMGLEELEGIVGRLQRENRIVERLRQGQRTFSTRFQFKRRMVRNMPESIVSLLEQPADQFLAELPLTAGLPEEARQALLEQGEKRVLQPEEILAWQGQKAAAVWVVQQGLLTRTRIKTNQAKHSGQYLHRGAWIGLPETLADTHMGATYVAAAPTTVLQWPTSSFFEFAEQHPPLSMALSRCLSQQLLACQQAHGQNQLKLWVVEGAHPQAGATTFALNLAWLIQQQKESDPPPPTLYWGVGPAADREPPWVDRAGPIEEQQVGQARIAVFEDGPDRLVDVTPNGYAPQVQLDMLLNELAARYEYIICDTGSGLGDEFTLRLRGQAQTLLTLTGDEDGAAEALQRWNHLQPYSYPGQKRILALQGATRSPVEIDARFHLLLPADPAAVALTAERALPLVQAAPESPLCQVLHEVYRRLSLNHAVALFVPSTMEVDHQVDNEEQVRATLSFLGNLFGGATSSNAEGAWRSEDSGLVTEQVTIVRTFVSKKALDTHLDDVIQFATDLKREMKQEAVAISVDNQLILI